MYNLTFWSLIFFSRPVFAGRVKTCDASNTQIFEGIDKNSHFNVQRKLTIYKELNQIGESKVFYMPYKYRNENTENIASISGVEEAQPLRYDSEIKDNIWNISNLREWGDIMKSYKILENSDSFNNMFEIIKKYILFEIKFNVFFGKIIF